MADIVERLRDLAACKHDDLSIAAEAADEITLLRAALENSDKRLAELLAALKRIDRIKFSYADDRCTLCAKAEVMRDIARAALEQEKTDENGY